MIILKFYVKGQRLFPKSDLRRNIIISSGTVDQIKCKFEFDESWDGFEKRVSFKNMNYNITKEALPDAEGYCYIPWEVIAHTGVILCTVTGTSIADFPARLTSSTVKFYLVVRNEGVHDSTITTDPSPSEYEQFILRVYEDAQSANEAKLAAIEAQIHAELAEARIRDMTVSAIAGAETDPPNVVKTDYGDHFNLEFAIPAGHAPVVTASKVGGVTTFSVDGEPVATVNDGIAGQDGEDGYSPIASVEKSGDTATITITDENGTTTAEVHDGDQNIWYGTCSTAGGTGDKVVNTLSGDFELVAGNMLRVKFSNSQTGHAVTLAVDGTTRATVLKAGGNPGILEGWWTNGEVVDFVYDGSYFVMSNKAEATTSRYGLTKLTSAVDSTSEYLASTAKAVKTAYDLANSKQDALVSGTNIKTINNASLLGSGNIDIQGGSDNVFVAEYGVTTYSDLCDALDNKKGIIVFFDGALNPATAYYSDPDNPTEVHLISVSDIASTVQYTVVDDDSWHFNVAEHASTDLATTTSDGLMGASDKSKLDNIIDIYVCEYGSTTFAEAVAALQNGKMLVCVGVDPPTANNVAFLSRVNLSQGAPTALRFTSIVPSANHEAFTVRDYKLHTTSGWSIDTNVIADYVESESWGTNSGYRKWASGRAEFWYAYSANSGLTTSTWQTPIGYADRTDFQNIWSGVFNAVPNTVNVTSTHNFVFAVTPTSITKNGCNLRFLSVTNLSNSSYSFALYAVGTWK